MVKNREMVWLTFKASCSLPAVYSLWFADIREGGRQIMGCISQIKCASPTRVQATVATAAFGAPTDDSVKQRTHENGSLS